MRFNISQFIVQLHYIMLRFSSVQNSNHSKNKHPEKRRPCSQHNTNKHSRKYYAAIVSRAICAKFETKISIIVFERNWRDSFHSKENCFPFGIFTPRLCICRRLTITQSFSLPALLNDRSFVISLLSTRGNKCAVNAPKYSHNKIYMGFMRSYKKSRTQTVKQMHVPHAEEEAFFNFLSREKWVLAEPRKGVLKCRQRKWKNIKTVSSTISGETNWKNSRSRTVLFLFGYMILRMNKVCWINFAFRSNEFEEYRFVFFLLIFFLHKRRLIARFLIKNCLNRFY